MRHRNTVKKFKRKHDQRTALLRDLVTSVVVYESVELTEAKAKAIRPMVERLITRAKKNTLANRRYLLSYFSTEQPVKKLLEVLGPRYETRAGGYTRLTKLGVRQGDAAPVVRIDLV